MVTLFVSIVPTSIILVLYSGRRQSHTKLFNMPPITPTEDIQQPHLIAGVDEVGRGPLAGAVVAAAVILNPDKPIEGLLDSKMLNEAKRDALDELIRKRAMAYCIAEASVEEIDDINILHASMLAMKRAIEGLALAPDSVLVDGNRCPAINYPCQAIVKGDQHVQSISAASIIAKVYRDRQMLELHEKHPEYGFDRHKGYPTAQHRAAIIEFGVTPLHRQSFAPVRNALMLKKDTTKA